MINRIATDICEFVFYVTIFGGGLYCAWPNLRRHAK